MRNTIDHRTMLAAVCVQQLGSEVRNNVLDAARARAEHLRSESEEGAQAAEYAMLGGVSAAACGGLIALLNNTDILQRIFSGVVNALLKKIGGWF